MSRGQKAPKANRESGKKRNVSFLLSLIKPINAVQNDDNQAKTQKDRVS